MYPARRGTPPSNRRLKVDAGANLHLPIAGHRGRIPEIRIIDIARDPAKSMPVEQIQQLAPELKSHLFGSIARSILKAGQGRGHIHPQLFRTPVAHISELRMAVSLAQIDRGDSGSAPLLSQRQDVFGCRIP